MKVIREDRITPNNGWFAEVDKGQVVRITGQSVIDLVLYNRADRTEWFDVARTRVYNLNIFPTGGHRLFSKHNNPMMRVLADGFTGTGHHDLQSATGCTSAMLEVLKPLGVAVENLPDPLGLFRNMAIDQKTGKITPVPRAPAVPATIELEAEIDLYVALVNCPDATTSPPAADATVTVLVS
jgi:uncharacterized protein YcgI (DUF1989 family)